MTIFKPGFALCVAMLAAGTARAGDFSIESAELAGGEFGRAQVSDSFGCHGQNISPSIRWSGVPEGTQSYLLTMFDADAPTRRRAPASGTGSSPTYRRRRMASRPVRAMTLPDCRRVPSR